MSLDNLGIKRTNILHNCEINNEKYDLVATPHKQTKGYYRTKRQTLRKKIITNKNSLFKNDFQSQETQSPNQKSVI